MKGQGRLCAAVNKLSISFKPWGKSGPGYGLDNRGRCVRYPGGTRGSYFL